MELVICAQDIRQITIGILDKNIVIHEKTIDSSPEMYLSVLKEILEVWSVNVELLTGVIVVTGPGSFTSSRVSTTIANAIAFSKNVPIVGLQNPERFSLARLLKDNPLQKEDFVVPSYDRPANITISKS